MRAQKAIVIYNGIELEMYQMPTGAYHMSKAQTSGSIDKHRESLSEWLDGKSPEALPYKGYKLSEVEIEGTQFRIHSVPIEMAAAYWTYWASRGNTLAQALVATSVVESLTRLCDNAFGVSRNESEIQQMNVQNMENNISMFELFKMMQNLTNQVGDMNRQMHEINTKYDDLKEENLELTEFKEDVEIYPEFLYLLEVAKKELSPTDYPTGVTCKEYIIKNNIPLVKSAWCTLSRRTASFYRSTKGRDPYQRGSHNIYFGLDAAYIVATLRLIMKGI